MGAAELTVRVLPEAVLAQPGRGRLQLHFDLWVQSRSAHEWELRGVEAWALDRSGAVVGRRTLDSNGIQPAILTLPERVLAPRGDLYLFNPFPDWRDDLPMASLRYRLHFTVPEGHASLEVDVAPQHYEQRVDLRLPLEGRILVDDGHDLCAHHRRIPLSHPLVREELGYRRHYQRYAWDLVLVDEQGHARPGAGDEVEGYFGQPPPRTCNEDYLAFGAAVLAPGSGVVVAARDDLPDQAPWSGGPDLAECQGDTIPLKGNHVIIDHGHGEFSELAHLQQDSLVPAVGQVVARGELIAQVGNNGSCFYPHLHYHLMTSADPARAEGLPAVFSGFDVLSGDGWHTVDRGAPETGEILRS